MNSKDRRELYEGIIGEWKWRKFGISAINSAGSGKRDMVGCRFKTGGVAC